MSSIKSIKAPIEKDLILFESHFKQAVKSKVPLVDKIMHYIVKRKGKQMRPMFVFLSAAMNGEINESTHRAASLIELLHTATLVHDDVVDDAQLRRGFFSVNALWKNKIAVLVGDYLLSKGLLLSIRNNEFEILKIVTTAVEEMSEGELLQMEKSRKLNIDEPTYFEIIRKKTATLIASCCCSGAESVGAGKDQTQKMWDFGEKCGIAFQIKDDLFDYGSGIGIGKPTGIDIREKKLTLPLIYTLNSVSSSDRRFLINVVKNHNTNKKKVGELINLVVETGGIEYTVQKMHDLKNQALQILNDFGPCAARTSIEELVHYTVERNK